MTRKKAFIAYLVLGLAALTIAGCTRPSPESAGAVQIGSPAPAFKLPELGGQEITLSQFRGKVVMLDFWATWCGPCRMTMPLMESLQKEFVNDLVLLAVNLQESKDEVHNYVRAQSIHARVLLDEEGSVGAAYGAEQIPMQILIDKRGLVRKIHIGFGPSTASQLRSEIRTLARDAL